MSGEQVPCRPRPGQGEGREGKGGRRESWRAGLQGDAPRPAAEPRSSRRGVRVAGAAGDVRVDLRQKRWSVCERAARTHERHRARERERVGAHRLVRNAGVWRLGTQRLDPAVDVELVAAIAGAGRAAVEQVLDGQMDVGALRVPRDLDPILKRRDRRERPAGAAVLRQMLVEHAREVGRAVDRAPIEAAREAAAARGRGVNVGRTARGAA